MLTPSCPCSPLLPCSYPSCRCFHPLRRRQERRRDPALLPILHGGQLVFAIMFVEYGWGRISASAAPSWWAVSSIICPVACLLSWAGTQPALLPALHGGLACCLHAAVACWEGPVPSQLAAPVQQQWGRSLMVCNRYSAVLPSWLMHIPLPFHAPVPQTELYRHIGAVSWFAMAACVPVYCCTCLVACSNAPRQLASPLHPHPMPWPADQRPLRLPAQHACCRLSARCICRSAGCCIIKSYTGPCYSPNTLFHPSPPVCPGCSTPTCLPGTLAWVSWVQNERWWSVGCRTLCIRWRSVVCALRATLCACLLGVLA